MREAEFAQAIGALDPAITDPRFGIYRNNIASALTNSLRVRYPVVEQLVGAEFFGMMARQFIADHKPSSAMLISYGEEFSEFIAGFAQANTVPYLAEVARFESAWWNVYHAADTVPLYKEALTALAPEAWGETRIRFLPSVKILNLEYSAVSIWRAHHDDKLVMPSLVGEAECALVHREGTQVFVQSITQDLFFFLHALAQGGTLLDAFEVASDHNEAFDVLAAVKQLFHFNIIAELYP